MHDKNRNNKSGSKTKPCMLSKEDLLVCVFYKLEYLSCISVMLPNFGKSLFVLFTPRSRK
jgi:hypothetical protein